MFGKKKEEEERSRKKDLVLRLQQLPLLRKGLLHLGPALSKACSTYIQPESPTKNLTLKKRTSGKLETKGGKEGRGRKKKEIVSTVKKRGRKAVGAVEKERERKVMICESKVH